MSDDEPTGVCNGCDKFFSVFDLERDPDENEWCVDCWLAGVKAGTIIATSAALTNWGYPTAVQEGHALLDIMSRVIDRGN